MTRTFTLLALASTLVSGCAYSPAPPLKAVPPDEALAGELRAEIWSDLQSNALIGNGNQLAARWANAGSDRSDAPLLHIQNLVCSGGPNSLHCYFGLLRDGGVVLYLGESAPDRLACDARFRRLGASGGWSIPRLPPGPRGGHSRITIKCQAVPEARKLAFFRYIQPATSQAAARRNRSLMAAPMPSDGIGATAIRLAAAASAMWSAANSCAAASRKSAS